MAKQTISVLILVLSILFFRVETSHAESKPIDINKIALSDTVQVQQALDNCKSIIQESPNVAKEQLKILEEKINAYPYSPLQKLKWVYDINLALMRVSELKDNKREAILYGEAAVSLSDQLGEYSKSQEIRVDIGNLYFQVGDKLKAMNLLYKSLNNWDGELPNHKYTDAYMGISRIHMDQNNLVDAENSLRKALNSNPRSRIRAEIYELLGQIDFNNSNYLASLEKFSQSLSINERLNSDLNLGRNYKNIANVFYSLSRYEKAENFYFLAIHHDTLAKNKKELAEVYSHLMNLETVLGNSEKAFEYGKMALENNSEEDNLDLKESVFLGLSEIHKEKKEYDKALEYFTSYNEILKTKHNRVQSKENSDFMVKYEIEKKERELEELNNQKRLSELAFQQRMEDNNKEKNMLFTFGVLMFIIIVLGAVILFNYQRQIESNKTIALKTEEINRVKIKELEKSLRLESANSMLKGQEIERKRIATDLHDSVGALLSSIKLHFESMKKVFHSEENRILYGKTNQLIDEACYEVRNISHDMMPSSLLKFGLIPALQDYTSKLKSNKTLTVDVVNLGVPDKLDNTISMNAYRIVQELLNNVIKHSQAKEVMVQLTLKGDKLNIMVEDDGIGFNPEIATKNGIGIKNIISRVNYLNGEIHIDTQEGSGTNIMIDFPLAS